MTLSIDTSPEILKISWYLGDDQNLTLRYIFNGTLFDTTGAGALFQIKENDTDSTSLLQLTRDSGITLYDTPIDIGGILYNVRIDVSSAQLINIGVGSFVADLQITDSLGKIKTPLRIEPLNITQDVSR
jgi:hypothetical protein